jgi:UDP-galactopyranose mutase
MYDYLIVGAGFAGSVLAERLSNVLGKRVLLIDKRRHVGGNAYDYLNDDGVLVHKYGPHIFHTNSRYVFDYLSNFTDWRPYEHHVKVSTHGRLVTFPINLNTIRELYNLSLTAEQMLAFLEERAEAVDTITTSEDIIVSQIGRELYELFFRGYTRKQWGLDPSQLDATVAGRIPVRTNTDDRYFTDEFQVMPKDGYTRMFERMLANPLIELHLGIDFHTIKESVTYKNIIYTGPIDAYFSYKFGKLPYRSLEFDFQTMDTNLYQTSGTINFPNDHEYTRITEFKHLTGQEHPKTTVCYEYPRADGDPYYPIPRPVNAALYAKYKELADATPNVLFVGRLGTYKYYNMDQVVAQALAIFSNLEVQSKSNE